MASILNISFSIRLVYLYNGCVWYHVYTNVDSDKQSHSKFYPPYKFVKMTHFFWHILFYTKT